MPWMERNRMSLRGEFVGLAAVAGANVSELCRRFGISRKTGYKWLGRAAEGLADRSRRPANSPRRSPVSIEAEILKLRDRQVDWGARKLKRRLLDQGVVGIPAVSTITAILHRHGRISEAATAAAQHWLRFEHPAPNDLWQIDFKGHFALGQGRCHPLTVLDDHSRFNVILKACQGENMQEVQPHFIAGFRRFGLPLQISCDNGPPWGTMQRQDRLTRLGAWLIRLGIDLRHNAPCHPQSNGKDERFHRTLKSGVISRRSFTSHTEAQAAFDDFRTVYNEQRPHDAIGLQVPLSRYRPSPRNYPESLPPVEYLCSDAVRKVDANGHIHFKNRHFRASRALIGERVAVRPNPTQDACYDLVYCHKTIRKLDLREAQENE